MKELFTQLFNAFKTDFKSAALALLVIFVGLLTYGYLNQGKRISDMEQQRYENERKQKEELQKQVDILLRPLIPQIQEATKKIDTAVNIVKDKYE